MATRKKPDANYEALTRALARIAELERKVALLEAQPREQHTHYHNDFAAPAVSAPVQPFQPYIVCGTDPLGTASNVTLAGWNG